MEEEQKEAPEGAPTADEREELEREQERSEFWTGLTIPVNEDWADDGTNFANPVEVADMFIRATGRSAELAAEAERISEAIANAEYLRDEARVQYVKLRRSVLSGNMSGIKSSWGAEVIEAYIMAVANDRANELLKLEQEITDAEREIRVRKPRLERIRNRMKRLETTMEWAKQWLDFEKLMQRVTEQKTGRRM